MNSYDLDEAVRRFTHPSTPNRAHVARVVRNLQEWADTNSDGWSYWPLPSRAAQSAIREIESRTHAENAAQEAQDLTNHQVRKIQAPIKAFCTRMIGRGLMTLEEKDQILAG